MSADSHCTAGDWLEGKGLVFGFPCARHTVPSCLEWWCLQTGCMVPAKECPGVLQVQHRAESLQQCGTHDGLCSEQASEPWVHLGVPRLRRHGLPHVGASGERLAGDEGAGKASPGAPQERLIGPVAPGDVSGLNGKPHHSRIDGCISSDLPHSAIPPIPVPRASAHR